jgi:ankyrin repeat protein
VLHAAVGRGDLAMVATVLDAGADVDGVDDAGDSALLVAATGGSAAIVEQLLAAGAEPNLANEIGHTPLVRAVGVGRTDLVELLLTAGATTEVEVEVGVVELLVGLPDDADTVDELDAQIELAAEAFGGEVDTSGLPSGTWGHARPLFVAAAQGDAATVQLLLAAGADPTVPGGLAGNLPVDAARIMGHDDVVALLGG